MIRALRPVLVVLAAFGYYGYWHIAGPIDPACFPFVRLETLMRDVLPQPGASR